MYGLPGGVGTQCNILTGSNTIWNCTVTDQKMDGNNIFDVSELFPCYFDVSFLCLVVLCFVFSVFLLFYVLSFYVSS